MNYKIGTPNYKEEFPLAKPRFSIEDNFLNWAESQIQDRTIT